MPSNHTLFVCADKTFTLAHSYFYEKVSTFTCEFCTCVIKENYGITRSKVRQLFLKIIIDKFSVFMTYFICILL